MKYFKVLLALIFLSAFKCQSRTEEPTDVLSLEDDQKTERFRSSAISRFAYEGIAVNDIKLNDSLRLSQLVEGGVLVIRFSELNCLDCVESMSFHLEKNFSEKVQKVVILGSFSSERKLDVYLRSLNIGYFSTYNIPEGSLNEFVDRQNVPYTFMLSNDMRVDNLFVPDYQLPKLTSDYFEVMSERLKITD